MNGKEPLLCLTLDGVKGVSAEVRRDQFELVQQHQFFGIEIFKEPVCSL